MSWARRELQALGIPALKRFGQHFLIDTHVRDRLIEVSELTSKDTVVEIGSGLGFLTQNLVSQASRVIAIEKDRTLANYLRRKFADSVSLTLIEGDALKMTLPDDAKIVSSPPYNISSKLVLLVLESHFSLAALLLQKEFVDRITAQTGSRDYGRLTVMLQSKAEAKVVQKVSRSAFYPQPRVDSAIVTIKPAARLRTSRVVFEDLIRTVFTQRRRKLRGVMTRYLKSRFPSQYNEIARKIEISDKRVFETTPKEFADLSIEIAEITRIG